MTFVCFLWNRKRVRRRQWCTWLLYGKHWLKLKIDSRHISENAQNLYSLGRRSMMVQKGQKKNSAVFLENDIFFCCFWKFKKCTGWDQKEPNRILHEEQKDWFIVTGVAVPKNSPPGGGWVPMPEGVTHIFQAHTNWTVYFAVHTCTIVEKWTLVRSNTWQSEIVTRTGSKSVLSATYTRIPLLVLSFYLMPSTYLGPALMALWSKALPLTSSFLSSLPGSESQQRHVRKFPVTWG